MKTKQVQLLANMQQGNPTLPCTKEKEMLPLQIVVSNAAKETRISKFPSTSSYYRYNV